MALLYGIHDQSAHPLVPAGGWIVESIALAENPQPQNWTQVRGDINWILRLNYAHNGRDGTIPLRGQYDEFAKRCMNYMAETKGANVVIIGNEPNHKQEYPNNVPIEPEDYATCFNLCYRAITHERPDVEVCVAAVAPWDITSGMDWLAYYKRMLDGVIECDGLAVHGYSHGADPNLIWSTEKVQGWYWHFPVVYQTIQAIPPEFADRPVHVTETDQGDHAWLDVNSSWVQNAYKSVNDHNETPGTQKICSLALYRWRGDKYAIHDKPQVQNDFLAAVAQRYRSPIVDVPLLPPTQPTPPEPPRPPTPTPEPEAIDWDPRLTVRGCTLQPALLVGTEQIVERVRIGRWFDRDQAQGRVNIYVRLLDDAGNLAVGVPVTQFWNGGSATKPTERKRDPWLASMGLGDSYSLDFPMNVVAPAYGIRIDSGNFGDIIDGCGLGSIEQPNYKIHTAYFFEWQLSSVPHGPGTGEPEPPGTSPPLQPGGGDLVHPLPGARITQHWGQNGEDYARFGMWGHNGCDLGGRPLRTPVRSMAIGVVAMSDFDPGYGHYVRVDHGNLGCYAMYCHLDEPGAAVGTWLDVGDTVGLLGTSGNSTGVHLHLEIRLQNKDGTYREDCPMSKGRCDPETWCAMYGLKL